MLKSRQVCDGELHSSPEYCNPAGNYDGICDMTSKLLKSLLCVGAAIGALASPAHAQLSHGISAVVNDDIITTHDLRQRVLFIMATTGVERTEEALARVQSQALRNLVDEKIQLQESEKFEQTIGQDEVERQDTLFRTRPRRALLGAHTAQFDFLASNA